MKFSLFLNTRQRLALLANLLKSIDRTFSYNNDIEILLGIDDDDFETQSFLDNHLRTILNNVPICDVIDYYIDSRPHNLHVKMNSLAALTKGDLLFVLNDDVEFVTSDWDILIVNDLEKRATEKDNIYYLGVHDTSIDKAPDQSYASFPILTRAAYEALGYFMSEKFVGLGGDVHLWRIFNSVGRILDNSEVVLDHVRHNTFKKVISPDLVALQMRENTYANRVDDWNVDISEEVGKINAKITSRI